MKCLYFILSHTNPVQVVRLVRTLKKSSPSCCVLIHHDYSKTFLDPTDFSAFSNVNIMSDCIEIKWGDFSVVEALLRSIDWALTHLDFDWFVFLSGQDYPVKPVIEIETFLDKCGYDALLRGFLVEHRNSWPDGEGVRRYYFRYYELPRFNYYYRMPVVFKTLFSHLKVLFFRCRTEL